MFPLLQIVINVTQLYQVEGIFMIFICKQLSKTFFFILSTWEYFINNTINQHLIIGHYCKQPKNKQNEKICICIPWNQHRVETNQNAHFFLSGFNHYQSITEIVPYPNLTIINSFWVWYPKAIFLLEKNANLLYPILMSNLS